MGDIKDTMIDSPDKYVKNVTLRQDFAIHQRSDIVTFVLKPFKF
jgi:hypothetical protein